VTDILLTVSLVISAIAASAAVVAVLRVGTLSDTQQTPPRQIDADKTFARAIQELAARLDDLTRQSQTVSHQLDAVERQLNELLNSDVSQHAAAAPAAAPTPPAPLPAEPPAPEASEPRAPAHPAAGELAEPPQPFASASAPADHWSAPAEPPPEPEPAASPPAASPPPDVVSAPEPESFAAALPPPSAVSMAEELVIGYRAVIGERSKGPIREWLLQNGSIALEPLEDGTLMPGDSGPIAAIMVNQQRAVLLPAPAFVVDFATRFAGSQISMRQVMRGCFDAVADGTGEMRLQSPAIARREGDRWVLERAGQLSGFTDAG
jgi:hypothetical protein